jgi:hypothetical protein
MICRTRLSRSPCRSICPCDRFLHVSSAYPCLDRCATAEAMRALVVQTDRAPDPPDCRARPWRAATALPVALVFLRQGGPGCRHRNAHHEHGSRRGRSDRYGPVLAIRSKARDTASRVDRQVDLESLRRPVFDLAAKARAARQYGDRAACWMCAGAQRCHFVWFHRPAFVAQRCANERHHLGDLLVAQLLAQGFRQRSRHGPCSIAPGVDIGPRRTPR